MMSNALVAQLLPAALTAFLLAGVLLVINPGLVAILAGVLPAAYVLRRSLRSHLQRWIEAFHRSFEAFSRGVVELVRTLDLTRSRAAETIEMERQQRRFEELRVVSGGMAFSWSAYGFVQSTVATVAGVVVLVFGGIAVARGGMTVGALVSFYVVMGLFNAQVRQGFNNVPPIIEGAQSLARLQVRSQCWWTASKRWPLRQRINSSTRAFKVCGGTPSRRCAGSPTPRCWFVPAPSTGNCFPEERERTGSRRCSRWRCRTCRGSSGWRFRRVQSRPASSPRRRHGRGGNCGSR